MKLANMAHLYTFLSALNLRNEDRNKNVVARDIYKNKRKLQDNLGTKRYKCSGHTKCMKSHRNPESTGYENERKITGMISVTSDGLNRR